MYYWDHLNLNLSRIQVLSLVVSVVVEVLVVQVISETFSMLIYPMYWMRHRRDSNNLNFLYS